MVLSRLARYPAEYYQILLALPSDGTPIDVDYGSNEAAHKERLQLYNFLKFLHRNPGEAMRFNNRHNLVTMSIKDTKIIFQLRVKAGSSALAQRLQSLAASGAITPESLDVELSVIPEAATDNISFEPMEATTRPEPEVDIYDAYAARNPSVRVAVPAESLPSTGWLNNPNAQAEMPESISRPVVPAGMGGPERVPPTRAEWLAQQGADIERDNAEGAAAVKAPELSAEMKAYHERNNGKPNQ